jgi:malate dehydrogenase (oxaloacetate-decarboxylating)(NADP+)
MDYVQGRTPRSLSLPAQVAAAGGIEAWNNRTTASAKQAEFVAAMCQATTVEEAVVEINAIIKLGHNIWNYAYMRHLYNKNNQLFYQVLLSDPAKMMPIVYTPTVGEACQKFAHMPFFARGCYVSIKDRGNFVNVIKDYAQAHLKEGPGGKYGCDCIVFSDGGRILGLGDLGAWGMGIPIGKLDLYTVCGGVDPTRTMPVIIDAGINEASANTAHIDILNDPSYTGVRQQRVKQRSPAGTDVNTCYFSEGDFEKNMITEFMDACVEVFGDRVILQFEDFNSNDAFPLLAEYRTKYISYNDDIQGTAAVCVAGILGSVKIKNPEVTDLVSKLSQETVLLHGAGSANLGAASLLHNEGKVPKDHIFMTNSRGVIWVDEAGSSGNFRNNEQKEFAVVGEPSFPHKDLLDVVTGYRPTCLVGAVGVAPDCFTKPIIDKMLEVNAEERPVIFALSNPKSQAEITSKDCYEWSNGRAIYGSGTKMEPVTVNGTTHNPGQVNNVFIFPGMSFGAVQCEASSISDYLFLKAAEAVANSLNEEDIRLDRVMPPVSRIREVSLNVATAVVLACQETGLARKQVGTTFEEVKGKLKDLMWVPDTHAGDVTAPGLSAEDRCLTGDHVGTYSGPAIK